MYFVFLFHIQWGNFSLKNKSNQTSDEIDKKSVNNSVVLLK